ncbi:RidA family protein [Sulfitobacter sp. F26204]|uniref:RidA family protein n=1 Tax=Sulfitobacter sp. F26204 TaxID=2996014 RepID=UPI00225E57F5|nr:RidA family protein [Sulfitobacter sp. F26204]MCX7561757.1 RidA family protein [Sulfitobacter sp. F26204]
MAHQFIQPPGWKAPKGYANGVLTKNGTLYIGGQAAWTADQRFESHEIVGQIKQTLMNILAVVKEAGGEATDITRLTWYVTDKQEYLEKQAEVGEVYRDVLGYHFPAMTMVVVTALVEKEALVEIEATAEIF